MRGRELWGANAVALAVGLAAYPVFRPSHVAPVAAMLIAGTLAVRFARQRNPLPQNTAQAMRLFDLVLNGLYGSFFAFLAYYVILAAAGQIGYPHR